MRLFLIERESPRNTISVSYCVMTYTVLLVALESENKTSSGFMCAPRARSRYCIISTFEQRSRYTFFVFITTNTFPPHTVGALSLSLTLTATELDVCLLVVCRRCRKFDGFRSVGRFDRLSVVLSLDCAFTTHTCGKFASQGFHMIRIVYWCVCAIRVCIYSFRLVSLDVSGDSQKAEIHGLFECFFFVLCTHDTESVQMIFCV